MGNLSEEIFVSLDDDFRKTCSTILHRKIKDTCRRLDQGLMIEALRVGDLFSFASHELTWFEAQYRAATDKEFRRILYMTYRAAVVNYCKYLMVRHRPRWWHCLMPGAMERRTQYEKALKHAIWCFENHYIHGMDL